MWEHPQPLQRYRAIRDNATKSPDWTGKEIDHELKAIDLYLMKRATQKHGMIWGKQIFLEKGLSSWLSSRTPSNISRYSIALQQKAICISVEHIQEPPKEEAPKIQIKTLPKTLALSLETNKILQGFIRLSEYQDRYDYMATTTHNIGSQDMTLLKQHESTNTDIEDFLFLIEQTQQ